MPITRKWGYIHEKPKSLPAKWSWWKSLPSGPGLNWPTKSFLSYQNLKTLIHYNIIRIGFWTNLLDLTKLKFLEVRSWIFSTESEPPYSIVHSTATYHCTLHFYTQISNPPRFPFYYFQADWWFLDFVVILSKQIYSEFL